MNENFTFRRLAPKDNQIMASIIRQTFLEFDLPLVGSVYSDPTTNNLYKLFDKPGAEYWVVEKWGEVVGGCGIYPTEGLPEGCAELVKFYMAPLSRGQKIGSKLVTFVGQRARILGYKSLYLEAFGAFHKAVSMYEGLGFRYLNQPMGNTGHKSCDTFMMKEL